MDKVAVREAAWEALRDAGASRFPGVEGRIPNFVGAEAAAELLTSLEAWDDATRLKANPDSPQLPVRIRALEAAKTLFMAVPRLADEQPFWRLAAADLAVPARRAASIEGASTHGSPVGADTLGHLDLVVVGSVAVERDGARLGKGGGYSDLEFAIATEAGAIDAATVVVTTVHPSQVLPAGTVPMADHDVPVDMIVTPDEVIVTDTSLPRPPGILDHHLDDARRDAIPVLRRRT